MAKMTESELAAQLDSAARDTAQFAGEFMADNTKYLEAYLGLKTGDFAAIPNSSSAISTDVQDVVESDMPSLARVFLGSGEVLVFEANTENQAEIEEVEQKTKYIDWIVRKQPDSFEIIHNWLKDALIQKNSVVKYFMDESKSIDEESFTNISEEELIAVTETLNGPDVKSVKIIEQDINEDGTYNLKFKVTRQIQKVCIINIPPEDFRITRNAKSIDDAYLVGDVVRKTRGELLADGFSKDLINQLPSYGDESTAQNSSIETIREYDQGGEFDGESTTDWSNQKVEIQDFYTKIDFDGDGIAERRHVMMSGGKILVNEVYDHCPYASLSAVLMPHKAIGRSRAELVYETQRQKTSLLRSMNDNIHQVNNPRNVVHPDVDLDDLLTVRPNGIVRLDDDTQITPQQAVVPLVIPYIGDKTLQVIQYVDQARAQSTGSLLANQGLDADKINKETATRFNGIKDNSDAKVELIARNFAETGFRKLYEGIAWLVSKFQDTQQEFRVLGKALTINPSSWKYKHSVSTSVGLGAGNNERLVESLQGIYAIQQQLHQQGSMLVDNKDMYNTLKRVVDGLGLPNVQEFFNNPDEPKELLLRQNELLNQQVLMMQQQMQVLQQQADNPLAEAELVKREGELAIAQGKLALDSAKLAEDKRQFDITAMQKQSKQDEDTALEITKLELDNNTELPGGLNG
jgi:hypothetical protein